MVLYYVHLFIKLTVNIKSVLPLAWDNAAAVERRLQYIDPLLYTGGKDRG